MTLVYYAEDERDVRQAVTSYLRENGVEVVAFPTGDDLMRRFTLNPCDLVLLDIMMPGASGIDVVSALRRTSAVPIILVTAKDGVDDFTFGLHAGADDYLTKPFVLPILLAKIQALLRRARLNSSQNQLRKDVPLQRGNMRINIQTREAFVEDRAVPLTALEFGLLSFYMEHPERPLSRSEILRHVWGIEEDIETRTVNETNRRLRKKLLGAHASISIQTVWGYGFKLVEGNDDQ